MANAVAALVAETRASQKPRQRWWWARLGLALNVRILEIKQLALDVTLLIHNLNWSWFPTSLVLSLAYRKHSLITVKLRLILEHAWTNMCGVKSSKLDFFIKDIFNPTSISALHTRYASITPGTAGVQLCLLMAIKYAAWAQHSVKPMTSSQISCRHIPISSHLVVTSYNCSLTWLVNTRRPLLRVIMVSLHLA